jgi:hypothetical protein
MTFAHPMFLQQQQTAVAAAQRARNQSGSEVFTNASGLSGNQQYLPASAPASSLLPPIPTQNAHASSLQSQIAALLSNSGFSGHNAQFGSQNPYGNSMGGSTNSQAAFSSNGGGGSVAMSNTMLPGMQNWNAERLGRFLFEIAAK